METKPIRVGFWGNFGTANWGNECTLDAILHNVRGRFPDAQLSCFCTEPRDTTARHGIESFPLRAPKRLSLEWLTTLGFARHLDALVMAGTGMITDVGEGPMGAPYDLFRWAVAGRAFGVKLIFVSVGVEPVRHPAAKRLIVTAVQLAHFRSFRDSQSKRLLERVGFVRDGDPVYPDLAFSLPESMIQRPKRAARQRRKVAVGLYDYCGRGAGGATAAAEYARYIEKLGTFVIWLLEHDYDVRVIIGDLTYDEPVVRDLRAWLDSKSVAKYRDRIEDAPAASVDEIIDQISDVDLVVASRFHNVLLSLLVGRPVVSISYNEKNDALMTDVGLAAYCQTIDRFEVPHLVEQLRSLEKNADVLLESVAAKVAAYRRDLQGQYEILFQIFTASQR